VSYAKVSPPQRTTASQIFADEIEQELKPEIKTQPLVEDQEEEEQEEVTVAYVETPSAPPVTPTQVPVAPVAPAAPAKNRRRVAVV
jgi:hypothetical protein